jgi:hypothetical protein
MTQFDRFLAPGIALGASALAVHLYAGFAPRIDVDCKGVRTIPACGSENDVPSSPLRGAITIAVASSAGTDFTQYVTYDTTTDEERVAPAIWIEFFASRNS